jgi:PAS fold
VIVVRADETIPFYKPAVASVLDLPFPPDRVTLADLRERNLVALRADGSPYPLEDQPLARALADRNAFSDLVYLRRADGNLHPYRISSRPFFDPDGNLIGVANYVTEATSSFSAAQQE